MRNRRVHLAGATLLAAMTTLPLGASVLLDTGELTFTPAGTQTDRLLRTGNASTWGEVKPFPGVTGDALARAHETFNVHVGLTNFLQINLDDLKEELFAAAYSPPLSLNSTPPAYGLDVNYLGDAGFTQPFGNPSSFQIVVPKFSDVVITINEVDPGGALSAPFRLQVEGFLDAAYTDVPEPSAALLGLAGLAALAAKRRLAA